MRSLNMVTAAFDATPFDQHLSISSGIEILAISVTCQQVQINPVALDRKPRIHPDGLS